jgi:hypothetical protein
LFLEHLPRQRWGKDDHLILPTSNSQLKGKERWEVGKKEEGNISNQPPRSHDQGGRAKRC